MNIDQVIDGIFQPISDVASAVIFFSVPVAGYDIRLILVWLVAAAFFFTLYLGFVNVRYFKHAIDVVRGKYDDPNSDGQINRFQALATSLSGTVGLGNIAGVAVAVSLGGPGAVFWMILMGLFGMSLKFTEVTLGVKYRRHLDPEHPEKLSGGPMYYLKDAFATRNMPVLGSAMAIFFAVCCMGGAVGGGNMFQSNQAYQQLVNVTGGDLSFWADKGWIFGLGLAFLVGVVIIGGIKSIAAVASKLVPVMGIIYLVCGLIVIGLHFTNIPQALITIGVLAFSPESAFGGILGALLVGVQRASFSNEAGLGSAAIVHATAKTNSAVSQGMVGMLGPFIDTVVICLITALVIVVTGAYQTTDGLEGVALTSDALEMGIPGARYVLALTVFLFAYSTLITWSYYGVKGATFIFGHSDHVELIFKIVFCVFIVIGASANLQSVIEFSDAMILAMGIPNIIGLYLLAPEVRRDLKDYIQNLKNKEQLKASGV